MKIFSAKFIKGLNGTDSLLEDGLPQIAFIGRSNVGKSSVINSLTGQKGLARTSSFPGCTREINIFLINSSLYLVDLPGYGFAKASQEMREHFYKMINWYFFKSGYVQKTIVLIIDAEIGLTTSDQEMLDSLKIEKKNVVVVANKVDKIKKSKYQEQLEKIKSEAGGVLVIPYSARKKIGIEALTGEVLK